MVGHLDIVSDSSPRIRWNTESFQDSLIAFLAPGRPLQYAFVLAYHILSRHSFPRFFIWAAFMISIATIIPNAIG